LYAATIREVHMADDIGTAARHELLVRLHDLLKAVRLFKNDLPAERAGVPYGALAMIDSIATDPAGACHLKDLAARHALDPSTVSRAVATLVRSGLVGRTADPADGRASVLALTPLGRQTLADVHGWADQRLADALRDWSLDDLTTFSALLRRFATDLMTRYDQTLEVAR
jgi:DNA-binding MarR family transcriptional regulator